MSIPVGSPPAKAGLSCLDEQLDFFDTPEVSYVRERIFDVVVPPITPILPTDKQISFYIPGSSYFLDLSHLMIEFELLLQTTDGNNVARGQTARVASDGPPPVTARAYYGSCTVENSIATSLIKNIDFRVNNVSTNPTHGLYAQTHFLINTLSYSQEYRNNRLELAGYEDEANFLSTEVSGRDRHAKSIVKTSNGQRLYVSTALLTPLTTQKKYLANLCNVNIDITLNSDAFCLRTPITPPNFQLLVQSAVLNVRKVRLIDSFVAKFEASLLKNPISYVVQVINCKTFTLPANILTFTQSDLFNSFLPSHCILGLMEQDLANGSFRGSPFSFSPNRVSSVHFNIEGQTYPSRVFKPNWAEGPNQNYSREYLALFRGFSQWQDVPLGISYERMKYFHALYSISFDDDTTNCRDFIPVKKASVANLQIDFTNNGNGVLKLFVFYFSTETIKLDSQRQLYKNFVM